ncbi:C6 zinc finger domain protein [Aspergillus ellipticus CBS 707.79]|uniref:C6 zinc finger domain protein n=1 Tax=Aspergillus ellipticus CBS 707.79 TaxID=1448320 RepID=A0A319DA35_9EURO|nr:C6 zinc finger domain protein [Aspergillus ellipticus CBS 707.79]
MLPSDPSLISQAAPAQQQQQQQLNRSCESCRGLKVRCLPDPSTPNQCQRCAKANRPCIFVAPQRRRPRKRTDSRVAQLEREMRQMRSLLKDRLRVDESSAESADSEREDSREPNVGPDFNEPISTHTDPPSSASGSTRHMDLSPSFPSASPYPNMAFDSGAVAGSGSNPDPTTYPLEAILERDVIDRGLISLEYANELVAFFVTELTAFAPIVVLPPDTTASQLRCSKPVLFLSVVAAAAVALDANLAAILNRELVRTYAERFFINGDKSLELVQALLLMIVFYYPPDSPLKLQFYQYTHIAATMALEIGLASKRRVTQDPNRKTNKKIAYDEQMAEQARAALGCYHLTSIVAMKTRRPNLLLFNDWMDECVKHLSRSPNAIDRHLAVKFELQRTVDEAMTSFGLDDTSSTAPLTESRLQAILRWFDNRMQSWKKGLCMDMNTVPMNFEYHYTNLAIYELAVGEGYRDPDAIKQQYYTLPSPESNNSTPLSAIRVDITIKWMNAAHVMLDFFLNCDTDMLRKIPNLIYTRVGVAIMSLLKIYHSVRAGGLGEFVTAETVNVDKYLEAMTRRLGEASCGQKYKIPGRWYFVVAVKARNWYDRFQQQHMHRNAGFLPQMSAGTSISQGISQGHVPAPQSALQFDPSRSAVSLGMKAEFSSVTAFQTMGASFGVQPATNQMWPSDQSGFHDMVNMNQFASYPPSMLPSQYVYETQQQRTPPDSGQLSNPSPPRTGMELDEWVPDGSVFAMPSLPGF